MSPVLKVLCRNVDIPLRYLCFCKFWFVAYHYLDSFWPAQKTSPVLKVSCRNIDIPLRYLCICKRFDHSIPLFGLFSTSSEKWALFWRFRAETLISCWDIYVFVTFDHSIPLFGLILTDQKMSPVLKVLCRNVDIPLRYLCFCKFWS